MADLSGQTIASSYEQLLSLPDGGGNANTLVAVTDGDGGTTFGIKLATNKVEIIPSAADDAAAFEVSKNDGTPVFTVNTSTAGASVAGTLTASGQTFIGGTTDEGQSTLLNIEGAGGTDDVVGILFKNTSASNDEEIMSLLASQGSDSVGAINIGNQTLSGSEVVEKDSTGKIRNKKIFNDDGTITQQKFDANEKNVRTLVSLGTYCGAQNNLVHGGRWSGENQYTIGIGSTAKQCWICNNIIYDLYLDNGSSDAEGVYGIYMSHVDWIACVNNTVYNVKSNSSTSGDVCVGMHVRNGWYDPMVCNNICLDTTADNGDSDDFGVSYGTQANVVSNYSSDDTSTGVDYQRGQSAADTFVSVDSGTEDFHLKNGSNALRAGKDMGANEASFHSRRMPYAPYDWDVDINGRDRDSEGDDWDIGAHQCEGCSEGGGTTNAAFWLFFD